MLRFQDLFFGVLTIVVLMTAQVFATADFEDLLDGTTYNNGDMFTSGGVEFTVADFTFDGGGTTSAGSTMVVNPNAAGAGNGMFMGNVNLEVGVASSIQSVAFAYAEFGGNVNLTVNGNLFNTDDFVDSDGVVDPDFSIAVSESMPGSNMGLVTVTGNITQISFGGQELEIDNVVLVPEPSGVVLFGLGGLWLLNSRGRRRQG